MKFTLILTLISLQFLIFVQQSLAASSETVSAYAAPQLKEPVDSKADWPSPVMDSENFGLVLFDLLEYDSRDSGLLTWDFVGWRGGDVNRLWIKSEGTQEFTSQKSGEADLQLLYGKLVTPFFDAQIGARVEQTWGDKKASRVSAVLGIQGLALYLFELEAAVFVAEAGHLAGRLTASKDFYFTQRFILQPRFETNAASLRSENFETGSGFSDLELGLRLRYEIKREVAPYIGVNWKNLFGETADFSTRAGRKISEWNAVAGIRLWY